MDNTARLKALGAEAAARVEDAMLVGLGTGSTAEAMVHALGARVAAGLNLTGVATSHRTAELARGYGIALQDLAEVDRIDICIDGADEIDPALNLVKGRGGALLFEKLVARRADRYLIIATDEKLVERLGTRMPLPPSPPAGRHGGARGSAPPRSMPLRRRLTPVASPASTAPRRDPRRPAR